MWRGGSCAAWCRPSLRWRQRFKWGWCEWEQNSLNWDRNAIRRGKIGAGGGRGLHSHSIDFVLWVWKCRSLSLRPMNGVFLCRAPVACSYNEDNTKCFFFRLQSLAFCPGCLRSSVRTEKTTTWLRRRGMTWPWSNGAGDYPAPECLNTLFKTESS